MSSKNIAGLVSRLPVLGGMQIRHRVQKLNALYLSSDEVRACEQDDAKKKAAVEQFFRSYPQRFSADKQKAEQMLTDSPLGQATEDHAHLLTEMLFCKIAYGFHPEEYVCYELQDKTPQERRAFLSSRDCFNYARRMNRIAETEIFNNKGLTYQFFEQYFRRDAVYLERESDLDAFLSYVKAHPVFVKKAVRESMGRSVERIDLNALNTDPKTLFTQWMQKGPHILEECIVQSECFRALNASSVNTVRGITFHTQHGIEAPYFFMKIGRSGSFVDNGGAGGILVGIDGQTGCLCTDGFDELNFRYEQHPDSKITFKGYQLPDIEGLKALCVRLSEQLPQVRYIGWDFAHTADGWVVVEGNGSSQIIGPQTTFKTGFRNDIERYMQDMKLLY